jgi:predicted neuraminidase
MADTPGFPDTNPCMWMDPAGRLWLFWPTILDNRWESALLKYAVSEDYGGDGPPRWNRKDVLHLKPGPEFQEKVEKELEAVWSPYMEGADEERRLKLRAYLAERRRMAEEKLSCRLGWMPRVHPVALRSGRLLLPLYSDGFDFSLMALSDDNGETWACSEPIIGAGNVQPSVVERRDGSLMAYFRDNGPPPKRVIESESYDGGVTWSRPCDTLLPDPGAGVEALALQSGRWVLINNDTEEGRHRLSLTVSEDEGRTWRFARRLEDDPPRPEGGGYGYPSILQASDGTIHATYSYVPSRSMAAREGEGESIKYVHFTEAWLMAGYNWNS